jgi:hypothetical protein
MEKKGAGAQEQRLEGIQMDQDIHVHTNISPIVGKILKVLMEPYIDFIAKLHADGRVSDAEIKAVMEQFTQKADNLDDFVEKELNDGEEADG